MLTLSMQRGKILIEGGEMKGKPGDGRFLAATINHKLKLPSLGGREAVKKSKTQSQDGGILEKM